MDITIEKICIFNNGINCTDDFPRCESCVWNKYNGIAEWRLEYIKNKIATGKIKLRKIEE